MKGETVNILNIKKELFKHFFPRLNKKKWKFGCIPRPGYEQGFKHFSTVTRINEYKLRYK